MGHYHVKNSGKGYYLKKQDAETIIQNMPDSLLPSTEWIQQQFDFCHREYATMDKEHKLVYLGCLAETPYIYGMPRAFKDWDFSTEAVMKELKESDSWYAGVLLSGFAILFAYKYGFPALSFRSIADYDNTWMFYCNIMFPPSEACGKLVGLSQEQYAKILAEFLEEITGEEYDTKNLSICNEYIKD